MEYTPEFVQSLEKLNLFNYVHNLNATLLEQSGKLLEKLLKYAESDNDEDEVTLEYITNWIHSCADNAQTIDALMHLLQEHHSGPAKEWLENSSEEEQIKVRDDVNTPVLAKMVKVIEETTEERTQRVLLEMLGFHE